MNDLSPIPSRKGIWFRIAEHSDFGTDIVEVYWGRQFIAAIYPPQPRDGDAVLIKVVSKHIQNSTHGIHIEIHDPPALVVRFDPLAQ